VFLSTLEPSLWAFEGVGCSGHGKNFKGEGCRKRARIAPRRVGAL
jgi:hypothetical protein